jgi:gluconate 2-dehydrogenase alpha chain
MDLLDAAAKRLGYHPYTTPAANLSQTYTNPDGVTRPACAYCGYCERFGCMIGAKSQPSNTLLPVLQKQKSFELRTGAWVRRVVHKDGKATGVQYVGANGEEFFQPAEIVVLASFTLSNVRLLALSKIGTQYDPVARKGTLGRYLTHQVDYGTKVFMPKPLNLFMGSGAVGLRLPDVDGDRVKPEDGVLRGGMIYFLANGNRPIANFGFVPQGSAAKNWGPEWKKAALDWADRVLTVAISGEHLSYRHNFMDLDPAYTDKFGDPLLRFTMDWTDHEHHQRALGARVAAQLGKEMGGKTDEYRPARPKYNVINYQSTHIQGGATMGPTPDISVVNRYSQHWNMPNLWVVGASSFPQNPSHNPTLTVLAAAYWAADALIKRYLKNPGKLV